MDLKTLGMAVFIATAYVGWPNLAKPLGLKPGLVPFVVIVIALVVVVVMAPKDVASITTISVKAFMVVFAFSIANGMAIYFYADKAADKNIQTGMFLVTVFVLQMTFAPIADWLITGVKPSIQQFVGLGLAAPAMWFLAQRPQ